MSKATGSSITEQLRSGLVRRSLLRGAAVVAASSAIAAQLHTTDRGVEPPEFREWYNLMLKQEALFLLPIPPDTDDEKSGHPAIEARMAELEAAMRSRSARSLSEIAVRGVLSLYWSDKLCDRTESGRRLLRLGYSDPNHCGVNRAQDGLIEAVLRLATNLDLLPDIKIWERAAPSTNL